MFDIDEYLYNEGAIANKIENLSDKMSNNKKLSKIGNAVNAPMNAAIKSTLKKFNKTIDPLEEDFKEKLEKKAGEIKGKVVGGVIGVSVFIPGPTVPLILASAPILMSNSQVDKSAKDEIVNKVKKFEELWKKFSTKCKEGFKSKSEAISEFTRLKREGQAIAKKEDALQLKYANKSNDVTESAIDIMSKLISLPKIGYADEDFYEYAFEIVESDNHLLSETVINFISKDSEAFCESINTDLKSMEKFYNIHEKIVTSYENREITLEEAQELNDIAYEKYVH